MGSRSLGSLTLDLVVKTGAFTAGMTGAERKADKTMSSIEKRAYKFGQVLGTALKSGAVIATAALTSVAVAVGQAIDRADEMRDLSIRTGIATEKLSEYAYAAKQTGTDIDGLGRGLKILAKNAAEAADATSGKGKLFEALGINVKDAQGNLKQLDALLPEVADKFRALEDGTTKAALAQELFGKSGLDLIEFLNQGSDGLDTAAEKARALGIIISSETAEAADKFNDRLGDLRAASEGFALQLAAKLLPQLIELVDKVNEFVGDGENATKVVNGLSNAVDFLAGVFGIADRASGLLNTTMSTMIGLLASAATVAQGLISLDFSKIGKGLSGGLAALQAGASQAVTGILPGGPKQRKTFLDPNRADFSGVRSRVLGQKSVEEMLADLFNGTAETPKTKKGSSGKSDAVKEADQLEESYKRMVAQQRETIALFGQEGEAAKVAYDIKNGELSKWLPERQKEVLTNAELIDQQKESKELADAARKSSDEQFETMKKGREATDAVISDLEFEIELLGKSNIERAKAIELRHLDANATDEQRDAVAKLTEELIRASENQQFLDDFKEGLADAFTNFITGAKSAKEAFGDFADQLFARAVQFVADKAIQAMFDAFSGGGTGSGASGGEGGGWQQWLGTIMGAFGGGRDTGGAVLPGKFYRVNESGMEMATVGGRDYLMTGSKGGMITPANKVGGSVYNLNNTFVVPPGQNQRTQQQQAQKMGQQVQEIQRRNS